MHGDILAQPHSDSSPIVIIPHLDDTSTVELYDFNISSIQSKRAEWQAAIL